MKNIPIWKKGLFYAMPFVIFFSVMEIGLRIAGFEIMGISPEQYYWMSDKNLGWRNKQNGKFKYNRINIRPTSTTDEYGYRNGFGWETTSNKPIVLFIGDSTVFSAEVNDEQTGPSEVAKLLTPEFNIRVLNAGVRGYNTVQAKRMLLECINRFSNVIIVVYVYCDNDYFENLNPLTYDPAKSPYVWWNKDRTVLSEIPAKYTSIPEGGNIYLNTINSRPFYFRFMNYLKRKFVFVEKTIFLSLDIIRILKEKFNIKRNNFDVESSQLNGELLHNKRFGYYIDQSDEQEVNEFSKFVKKNGATEALIELLGQMKTICKKEKIFFITTSFGYNKNSPDNEFADIASKAGVKYVEMSSYFADKETDYASLTRSGSYDPHFGVKGTKTFAKALLPEIKKILTNID